MALPYLLEFFDVDVKLAAKFGLGLRESRNLRAQGPASGGFVFCAASLLFVFGSKTLDFSVFAAQNSLVMQLSRFKLFSNGLYLCAEAIKKSISNIELWL